MFESIAYAQGTGETGGASPFGMFMPMIIIFVIFWFFLIRPQKKRADRHREMLGNLKKGDKVITNGGLFGTVLGLTERKIVLRVSEDVKMEFLRSAVQGLASEAEKPQEKDRDRLPDRDR